MSYDVISESLTKQVILAAERKAEYVKSPYAPTAYYAKNLEGCLSIIDKSGRDKAIKEKVAELVASGEEFLLPHRLGIIRGAAMTPTQRNGWGKTPQDSQLKANYTSAEVSPYKQYKPYGLHTGLRKVAGEDIYYYGTIGITNQFGRINSDNGDLVVIRTADWERLEVFIFRGFVDRGRQLDSLPEIISILKGI